MKHGSWPLLGAAAAVFLLAFAWQRQRSPFLAIEAAESVALPVARAHGLSLADVFALRESLGVDAQPAALAAAAATFAADRDRLGCGLAAVALFGDRKAAEAARSAAADPAAAWQRFQIRPEAAPGLRFLAVRQRFAARQPARD